MGKNIYEYQIKASPVDDDFVLGTDSETGTGTNTNQETVNFKLVDIAALGPWRIGTNNNLSFTGTEFVGIGTETPSQRVTIADGNLQVGSDTNNAIVLYDEVNDHSRLIFNNTNSTTENYIISYGLAGITPYQLALKARNAQGTIGLFTGGNIQRMHITADGKTGFNTTTPISTVHINGTTAIDANTSTSNALSLKNVSSGRNYIIKVESTGGFFRLYDDIASSNRITVSTSGWVGLLQDTPTEVLHVNGNVLADNVSVPSDITLKEDIYSLDSIIDKVVQLGEKAKQYTLKKNKQQDVGFIAQDVEKIFPDVVTGNDVKAINYPKLTVYLAKAFSELCHKLNI